VDTKLNKLDKEFVENLWNFLRANLSLEWIGSMLAYGLKPVQRVQGPPLMLAGKDSIRRMLAYHRSAMLEVCRFATTKWPEKVS
jgi:hypothetical protein